MAVKDRTISTVRGIAIVLVVYGHVIQRSMAPWGEDFFSMPAFKTIYTFHMPLFVFISGYLVAYSLCSKSVLDAFKSRCKGLLVPFLSWGTLGVVTNYFLNIIDGKQTSTINFPMDMIDQLLIDPVIWFLFTLFAMSCLLLVSIHLEKKFGVFIFAAIYVLLLFIPYNNYCSLYYIKWFYAFYVAGYWTNRCGLKRNYTAVQTALLVCLFVLLVTLWNKNDYIYINKMVFSSDQYALEFLRVIYRYVVGFLGIWITFCVGAYLSKTKLGNILGDIGIYSLDIYLIQRYIVEGIYPRIVSYAHLKFDFTSPLFSCFWAPIIALFFVYMCMGISRSLIRRSKVLNVFLLGGRV